MGYKAGEGLGQNGRGIAKPVEAKLRPKGFGMGYGPTAAVEPAPQRPESKFIAPGSAAAAASDPAGQKLWKKTKAEARTKRTFRTAAEVLEDATGSVLSGGGHGSGPATMTILDMRGPQTRLITNMEQLNMMGEDGGLDDRTPMPELQRNLALLVDMTQAEIQRLDARLQAERDTATLLARERVRQSEEAARKTDDARRLTGLLNDVARCQSHDASLGLEEVEELYSRVRKQYREEYVLYNLAAVALAQALPRLSAAMRGWAPFLEPHRGVSECARWRILLETDGAHEAIFQDVPGEFFFFF
jgi:tuftelin-interacting protein 11